MEKKSATRLYDCTDHPLFLLVTDDAASLETFAKLFSTCEPEKDSRVLTATNTFSVSELDITPSAPVAPAPYATNPVTSTTSVNAQKDSTTTGPKCDLELSFVHKPITVAGYRLIEHSHDITKSHQ